MVGDASDGSSAIEPVEQTAPDVVLMDLSMPGMPGIDATARCRGGSGVPEESRVELTERELEALRLMVDGRENAEIAAELFISVQTVKNHVSNILGKLEVDNRIQAAVKAVRERLL